GGGCARRAGAGGGPGGGAGNGAPPPPPRRPPVQVRPEVPPVVPVRGCQVRRAHLPLAGGQTGEQPGRPPQHQRRRGPLAAGGPPLVVPVAAEQLLQVVVGPREARGVVAVEQPWPVPPADLQEVIHRGGQLADGIPVPPHRPHRPAQPRPDRRTGRALRPEDVGRLVHPAVGPADQPPQPGRRGQRPVDEPLEPAQLGREPPCAPARPMLPLIALSRSWSLSPEAASGGRPSSVRALRTAAQDPPTTSAPRSGPPSPARPLRP